MKKNDVFTFTAPNGNEVQAVCIDVLTPDYCQTAESEAWLTNYLCYAQNRLFYYQECREIKNVIDEDWLKSQEAKEVDYFYALKYWSRKEESASHNIIILVDYCILPDYDELLQLHSSLEYPQWEQNLEEEIQGTNDR